MKEPKLNKMSLDKKGTKAMRAMAAKSGKVKITINIDRDSLDVLKEMALETGASYQKLLNQLLKDGLSKKISSESRLDKLEKEIEKLKKKLAA